MFRAAMIAVLFTLTLGHNVGLVCGVLCKSYIVSDACAHETISSVAVVTHGSCSFDVNDGAAFIREDRRSGSTAVDPSPALAVAGSQLRAPAEHGSQARLGTSPAPHAQATPIIALRI